MPAFERGDVVRVPFPYSGAETAARRPALVVATAGPAAEGGAPLLIWALMITSAENRPWPDDVGVTDLAAAGLPAPSVVRCAKIATLDARRAERIGRLDAPALEAVRANLAARLGGG
jgi:mRNA interferase MazF